MSQREIELKQIDEREETSINFVETLLPFVKESAYIWIKLQEEKRLHDKEGGTNWTLEEEKRNKEKLISEKWEVKQRWASKLLNKIEKSITSDGRKNYISAINGKKVTKCISTKPNN